METLCSYTVAGKTNTTTFPTVWPCSPNTPSHLVEIRLRYLIGIFKKQPPWKSKGVVLYYASNFNKYLLRSFI